MKKNQKGFTAIESVLSLLILVAIIAAGFYVFQARQGQITSSSLKQSDSSTKSTQEAKEYFEIKEWGVKFKLNPSLKDLYYVIETHNDGQFAYFSTRSLDKKAPECSAGKTSQVAIGRYTQDPKINLPTVEIDGKVYTSSLGQSTCTDDPTTQELVKSLRENFFAATATLESIQK